MHIAGLCSVFAQYAAGQTEPDLSDFGSDVVVAFRREHKRLIDVLGERDPSEPATTWGLDQHIRFFHRRAAQELAVHRWDFEDAVASGEPIDSVLAADGIDEFLTEFFAARAAEGFGGTGQSFCIETSDTPGAWTFAMHPDRIDVKRERSNTDVHVEGPASDLLLFTWGRIPPDTLTITGDASLVDRWRERVKI